MTSAGNLATYAKLLLGSVIKCDTSETNSSKIGNEFFISFTTDLKTLFKPFPIVVVESSDPFRPPCACLILSRILNLAYLELMSGCM